MKKHNVCWYYSIMLIFITFSTLAQVTNTISEVKINNEIVSQINFEGNPIVNVNFKVNLKTLNGTSNNILGNVFIYSKKSTTDIEIQRSFSAVAFTVTYPPFVSETTYNSEVYFTVTLNASEFNDAGGVLYAEYENNSGQKYKSNNINIVKINPTTPSPGITAYFDIESMKYAERGYSVEGGQVLIHKGQSSLSLNISYAWHRAGGSLCGDKITYTREKYNSGLVSILNLGTVMKFPSSPCVSTFDTIRGVLNTFKINTSEVNNKQLINIFYTPKNSPYGDLGIRKAKLVFREVEFSSTDILPLYSGRGDDAYVASISGKRARISLSETISQNYETINAEEVIINQYEWYSRPLNGTWSLTTQPDYELLKTITVTTQFFRRAVYKGVYEDSNILTFEPYPAGTPDLPIIRLTNSICCDQTVPLLAPVRILIGNVPNAPNYSFRWQSSPDATSWYDIVADNAFSKDFTPDPFYSSRAAKTRYFRRAVITSLGISYSNYVKIQMGSDSARISNVETNNDTLKEIQLYPNPTSDYLSVESIDDLSAFTISVYDSYGNKKNIGEPVYDGSKINLNAMDLPVGVYLLVFENGEKTITKQFIKK